MLPGRTPRRRAASTNGLTVRRLAVAGLLALASGGASLAGAQPEVNESARQIPVAYRVDVVVVGGSTGAVSAAVAAAEEGATVFLAAPRPYLGDDMTATLRLWLEEGETPVAPLAKRIFRDQFDNPDVPHPRRLDFTYEADLPSAGVHKDTTPPRMLCDSIWGNPYNQTVQYDGDVNLTIDLGEPQAAEKLRLMFHHGEGPNPYKVGGIEVSASDDKKTWRKMAEVDNSKSGPAGSRLVLSAPLETKSRYVKLSVRKAPDAKRFLLGEIEIIAPAPPETDDDLLRYPPPRPMHVKRELDCALLAAGVPFLYGCYATDVLRDEQGRPSGIVMANRAGRQAVVAKTIIDATDRAWVARMAGAKFRPFPAGVQTLKRVVIGGETRSGPSMTSRVIEPPFRGPFPNDAGTSSGLFSIIEYTLQLPLADDGYAAWAEADQKARAMTYHPEQQFTSDVLFQVPPDSVHSLGQASGPWQGVERLPVEAFRPQGVPGVLVLGGCADVSREQAERLLRPLALIDLGARLGNAAAAEAKSLPAPTGVKLPGRTAPAPAADGDVREMLGGVRPGQELPTVPQDARGLPVLGNYDVVVIGGGTAGAPAGIGAARQGAKTLVVEYLHGLGGVGTMGAISKYYYGNCVGFTAEIAGGASWVIEQKMEWYRSMLGEAGADVWLGTLGCGAFVEDGRVAGAVVATPQGRGVVLAKAVIDATGNADVAAAAGAECVYTDESEFAMQGTGLPPRRLGATYTNTDFTYTDETDLVDVWHLLVYAKEKYATAFDLGQLVDTRERRRIVGDFTVTLLDQMAKRTYPDTIVEAASSYDTHSYTVDPYSLLKHPMRESFRTYLPYRCLLPKGLDGILVSGIGVSAHRDAQPLVRMQPDVQNQGYAAGVAAAMAAESGVGLREIDVRRLQKHLVEIGNLPESVLADEDSFPVSDDELRKAVDSVHDESQGLALILANPPRALPLLQRAHEAAEGRDKLAYAKILGMLGDAAGLDVLLAEVDRITEWDPIPHWRIDRNYEQYRDVGWSMSHLDNTIMAIGRTGERRAVPVLLKKLSMLTPSTPLAHHRAVCSALERIGDPAAAQPLAELLAQPEMSGHALTSLEPIRLPDGRLEFGTVTGLTRSQALRELIVARALYRCGDCDGLGERILTGYTGDLRGHFARHARAVLGAGSRSQ